MKDLKQKILGAVIGGLVSTSSLYAQDENWHAVSGTGFTSVCDRPDIGLNLAKKEAHARANDLCLGDYEVRFEDSNYYPCNWGGHWGAGDQIHATHYLSVRCQK